MSSESFVTSEKFLGYEMKWRISEPDSPKGGKSSEMYFTVVLNTLCKLLPMFHASFNDTLHSNCLCLIRSHIL